MANLINNFIHHTITKDGIVTNLKTGNIKSYWIGANGYYHVDIQENGKAVKLALHRLLANQYIPNLENKRTVNHIDGNKLNNSLSNLEWATDSENLQHAYSIGLQPNQSKHDKEFLKKLLLRFLQGESITSISKDPIVKNTLTQTSIQLRKVAIELDMLIEYEAELSRQKTKRASESGVNRRKIINLKMLDKDTLEVLQVFSNLTEARTYLGVKSCGPISNVLSGRQKTAYGYKWVS